MADARKLVKCKVGFLSSVPDKPLCYDTSINQIPLGKNQTLHCRAVAPTLCACVGGWVVGFAVTSASDAICGKNACTSDK